MESQVSVPTPAARRADAQPQVCPAEQVDAPLQSPSSRQPTQMCAPVSHLGVPPLQSPSSRQPTQMCAPVSQPGVEPPQSVSLRHWTQVFGFTPVLHTGRPGTLAQSAALVHSAQFPEMQAAAVALVQLASDAHSTQAADTQYGSTPAKATHTPPPPPQALGVPPARQVPPLTQPVQHAPALQTPLTPAVVQENELFTWVQAPPAQPSVVHTLLSSHDLGVPLHMPKEHTSLTVQPSPSLQLAVLFV